MKSRIYHELQEKCRRETTKAIQSGLLAKPVQCSKCLRRMSSKQLHAHHHDYNHPLAVTWLCFLCHRKVHKFLNWMEDCIGWLEHCELAGIDPACGGLPICHKKTGKPMKSTWFQYWKQHHKKR